MPPGRAARQRRGQSLPRSLDKFTPRVDVFGTLRMPSGEEFRCRLIEYAPSSLAAFTASDPENPLLFRVDGEFAIKGRLLSAELEDGSGQVKFQKAGCGCETPHQLRGARAPLLAHLPQETLEDDDESQLRVVPFIEALPEDPAVNW